MDDGRQYIRTNAAVDPHIAAIGHRKVLEKRERKDEAEKLRGRTNDKRSKIHAERSDDG